MEKEICEICGKTFEGHTENQVQHQKRTHIQAKHPSALDPASEGYLPFIDPGIESEIKIIEECIEDLPQKKEIMRLLNRIRRIRRERGNLRG